jgi:putative transposase
MLDRLHEIFTDLCAKWECELVEFHGEPDHVHLLVCLQPRVAPSVFVGNVKTVTSRLIRKEFAEHLAPIYWKPVFWSRSYCVLSVGGAPLSVVKQYIENQTGAE